MNKRGQTWSMDIVIAVTLFIAAGVTFFALFSSDDRQDKFSQVQEESQYLVQLTSSDNSPLHIIDRGKVNQTQVIELANSSFDELQRLTNIENDFCIYFEDTEGNIVLINNSVRGIGSSEILIGGQSCS